MGVGNKKHNMMTNPVFMEDSWDHGCKASAVELHLAENGSALKPALFLIVTALLSTHTLVVFICGCP